MDSNLEIIRDLVSDMRSKVEREQERVQVMDERAGAMEYLLQQVTVLQRENEQLKRENADLGKDYDKLVAKLESAIEERDELKKELTELRMQLAELNKMAEKVGKHTVQEDLVKALRTFMNVSRRKQVKKRGYIKMVILEYAQSLRLVLPDDMTEELETFDDEEPRSTTVNVHGGTNICHAGKVETGGAGDGRE